MEKRDLLYTGKAKSVFATDDADHVVIVYRNDTSAFDGKRIKGLFDHTNHRRLSIRVAADRTELLVANVVATLAVPHLCFEGH